MGLICAMSGRLPSVEKAGLPSVDKNGKLICGERLDEQQQAKWGLMLLQLPSDCTVSDEFLVVSGCDL